MKKLLPIFIFSLSLILFSPSADLQAQGLPSYVKKQRKRQAKIQKKRLKSLPKHKKTRTKKKSTKPTFTKLSIRHFQGMKGIELGVHTGRFGDYYSVGVSRYMTGNSYVKASGGFESGNVNGVGYQNYNIDIDYLYTFYKVKNFVYFNVGAGVTSSFDQVTSNEILDVESKMNFGFKPSLEVEMFLTDKLAFIVKADQRLYLKKEYGSKRWFAGAGIKFIF